MRRKQTKKPARTKKLPLAVFRELLADLLRDKASRNTATGFDMATGSVLSKLKRLGANPWQIGRFKQLVKKAPIKGGYFKLYAGD